MKVDCGSPYGCAMLGFICVILTAMGITLIHILPARFALKTIHGGEIVDLDFLIVKDVPEPRKDMRPSGLHVNKPVIFGLFVTVVTIVLVFRHLTKSAMPDVKVSLSADDLEAMPELSDEAEKALKRESKEIDIKVDDKTIKIHVEQVIQDGSPKLDILFLHGASFSSKHWLKIKSPDYVAIWGYRAVAIDLPGKDKSPVELSSSLSGMFLDSFIKTLEMKNIVIIAPSASGNFALPYLFNGTNTSRDSVVGFVPVAPVGTQNFRTQFSASQVKTLIIYGSKDVTGTASFLDDLQLIPNHKVVKIEDAGHACYMEKPDDFHKSLFHFLKELAP